MLQSFRILQFSADEKIHEMVQYDRYVPVFSDGVKISVKNRLKAKKKHFDAVGSEYLEHEQQQKETANKRVLRS